MFRMEPMTLGSAPSSPASAGMPCFLPNFLMGDQTQPNNLNNTSPGRNRTTRAIPITSDSRAFSKVYNQSIVESPQAYTPHKTGPPSQSLFDTIDQVKKCSPLNSTILNDSVTSPNFSKCASRIADDSVNYSKIYNETGNYLGKNDQIDTHWVTVFGFPPSALSSVLAQLSNCGVILEKRIPSQGNWMHAKFANLNDVPRALALNGRCIDNNIMIGVTLHYTKENKENEEQTFTSPIRARSLRQSFISPSNVNSVLPPQNVPQKSTGIVSKAMEYVFGW